MDSFPAVDPIPLPAPVWLFKVLHPLTFTLHALAFQLLLGGVALVAVWALWGRLRSGSPAFAAARAAARPLPVLMTFVINLGVPPLLFSQVLYGRALYTSSILIGVYWIAVILLLMAGYQALYLMAGKAGHGRWLGWLALLALALFLKVALIYTNNFTLLVRPEVWAEMYRRSPVGAHLAAPGDPTVMPRWLFFAAGSLAAGGVGVSLLGLSRRLEGPVAVYLRLWGGRTAAAFALVQGGLGLWVFFRHGEAVRSALMGRLLPAAAVYAWPVLTAALLVAGLAASTRARARSVGAVAATAAAAFLAAAALVLAREGIRDAALRLQGFDVWSRRVETNWGVVALFLGLFVAGLGGVAWLVSVAVRSRPEEEAAAGSGGPWPPAGGLER